MPFVGGVTSRVSLGLFNVGIGVLAVVDGGGLVPIWTLASSLFVETAKVFDVGIGVVAVADGSTLVSNWTLASSLSVEAAAFSVISGSVSFCAAAGVSVLFVVLFVIPMVEGMRELVMWKLIKFVNPKLRGILAN